MANGMLNINDVVRLSMQLSDIRNEPDYPAALATLKP